MKNNHPYIAFAEVIEIQKKYLKNIWRIINWEYVNRRIYAGDRA
jgi:superoxide dismutase